MVGDTDDEPVTARRAWPGLDPAVPERILGAAVTAAVPRLGEKIGAQSVWSTVPVPRWSDMSGARDTRRTLLLAAARRFSALGYHGTSLVDILTEAAVDRGEPITKGALYFHFSSKHDLAQALVDETLTSWGEVVATISVRGLDPLWNVLDSSDAAVAMSMYDPLTRGARRIRADHESFARALHAADETELDRLGTLLVAARDRRLLRMPADPIWTADHLRTMFAGHRARSEDPAATRFDLWDRMTSTWQALMPALADEEWLRGWRASGWARRPRPDPEAYRVARRPDRDG